jgi:hypothetical protein
MAADLLARCWDVDHLEAISDLPQMMVPNLALAS